MWILYVSKLLLFVVNDNTWNLPSTQQTKKIHKKIPGKGTFQLPSTFLWRLWSPLATVPWPLSALPRSTPWRWLPHMAARCCMAGKRFPEFGENFFPSVEDNWWLPTDVQLIFLSWGILGLFTRFMTSLDTSNDYLVMKKSHQWRFTFLGVRCSLNSCEKAGLFSFGVRDNIPGISHAAQDSLGRQSRNSTCRVELSIPTTSPSA